MKQFIRKHFKSQLYYNAYSRAFFTLHGIVIKEIRVSFQQFFTWQYPIRSFLRVLGIIGSSLNRLCLGRSLKYSFAYTGEDRIIESILKPHITHNGYFVDVGCNHPIFFSNTYSLYRKGWQGLCVDANPGLRDKFSLLRPRDKFVLSLVSNNNKEREFYIIQNDVLSSTEKENAELALQQGMTFKTSKYIPETLTDILQKHNAPFDFDLLSIDAEEHDYQVLLSLDFSLYRPKLVVVEDELFNMVDPLSNVIVKLLNANGYQLYGYILKNLYFIRTSR